MLVAQELGDRRGKTAIYNVIKPARFIWLVSIPMFVFPAADAFKDDSGVINWNKGGHALCSSCDFFKGIGRIITEK
jgi:hypothetical protein